MKNTSTNRKCVLGLKHYMGAPQFFLIFFQDCFSESWFGLDHFKALANFFKNFSFFVLKKAVKTDRYYRQKKLPFYDNRNIKRGA